MFPALGWLGMSGRCWLLLLVLGGGLELREGEEASVPGRIMEPRELGARWGWEWEWEWKGVIVKGDCRGWLHCPPTAACAEGREGEVEGREGKVDRLSFWESLVAFFVDPSLSSLAYPLLPSLSLPLPL